MGTAVELGRNAGVGADDLHVALGIGDGNRDLVADAAGGKRSEALDPGLEAIAGEAGRDGGHVLLGNAAVKALLGELGAQAKRSAGFSKVRVENDDVLVFFHHFREARGINSSHFHGLVLPSDFTNGRFGLLFADRAVVVAGAHVFDPLDAAALQGVEDDHGGLSAVTAELGMLDSLLNLLNIVAVFHVDDVPAKRGPLLSQRGDVIDLGDGAVDLLLVVIGKGDQVVQLLRRGEHGRFPDLAFLALAVADHGVDRS